MKKQLLALIMVLGAMTAEACPPSTGHCIVTIGANYDYSLDNDWTKDLIGLAGTIGYETSNRYVRISATGSYAFGRKNWQAGGEIAVNPLGIRYGYETPINFAIIAGGGYKNNLGAYASTGLEISGGMGKIFTPYARCTYDMNFNNGIKGSVNMSVGLRFWIGKGW